MSHIPIPVGLGVGCFTAEQGHEGGNQHHGTNGSSHQGLDDEVTIVFDEGFNGHLRELLEDDIAGIEG